MDSKNSKEDIEILREELKSFQEEMGSRFLGLEAAHAKLILREYNQKRYLRWCGLLIGGVSLVFMGGILVYHLSCWPLLSVGHNLWALIVAPVASISVITVALLAATFYEGKGLDKMNREGLDKARDSATIATNLPNTS